MSRELKIIEKDFSDAEIMRRVLEELRYSALAFAKKLEYSSHSTIHHILSERNKISDELVDRIVKKFPEVNYWFLKKGRLPVVLDDKLARNQMNILVGGHDSKKNTPDYSVEMFATMKNIEVMLARMLEIFESKN